MIFLHTGYKINIVERQNTQDREGRIEMENFKEFMNSSIGVQEVKPEPSFVMLYVSFMDNEAYTQTEKNVYLALKSFCIHSTMCFPTQASIMRRAGIKSNSTIYTTLKSLEEKGVIVSVPDFDEKNKRRANKYYLAPIVPETGEFDKSYLLPFLKQKERAEFYAKANGQGRSRGRSKKEEATA